MKIVILTSGSRGDVQPLIALGKGLKAAGHQVKVATHEVFRRYVEAADLDYAPMAGDPEEMLASEAGQQWVRSGSNSFAFLLNFIRLTRPHFRDQLRDCQRAAEGADFIIFTPFAGGGMDVAERMGVPVALAALQPFHPTREFPAMGAKGTFDLPFLNWGSHRTTEYLMWLPFRDIYNRWREQDLGLPPRGLKGPMTRMEEKRIPTIYGYSPSVIPRPKDWSPWVHVTGYWYTDLESDWKPPKRLQEFLKAGDPPIFMGFGSMVRGDGETVVGIARETAEVFGKRVVLQSGWQGFEDRSEDDRMLVIDSAPHSWLFPRMAAVVHHGGAGTTAAGLRAGVPNVLVPHFADQFFWADWVVQRRAGPEPVPRNELSTPLLVDALCSALSAPIRAHAAELGGQIRAEDGVAKAVAVLEREAG